ncbi:putative selenocysteine lyase, partial [Triplophysa rosa]
ILITFCMFHPIEQCQHPRWKPGSEDGKHNVDSWANEIQDHPWLEFQQPQPIQSPHISPHLEWRRVLSTCRRLLASVGAACHSDRGDQASYILLNCGIPHDVATNALRISVGRSTSREDVDIVVEDLRETVEQLERIN